MGPTSSVPPQRPAASYRIRAGTREYPAELAAIADPPREVWVRGRLDSGPRVAVVGSRACTRYGRRVATDLGTQLAHHGITVVSGLAWGIDAAAHRGALAADGITLAVLPGGVEPVYPPRHRALAADIVRRGALVAEKPAGSSVARWDFPRRNRIIAGLAAVTIVVEAAARSGARITADLALDYGRDVLVVPGLITSPTSAGCQALLRDGAGPCTGVQDVLELLLGVRPLDVCARGPDPAGLSHDARLLLSTLRRDGSSSVETLAATLGQSAASTLPAVTELEIHGWIQVCSGGRIELAVNAAR